MRRDDFEFVSYTIPDGISETRRFSVSSTANDLNILIDIFRFSREISDPLIGFDTTS